MGSLFDLAAELIQYDDAPDKSRTCLLRNNSLPIILPSVETEAVSSNQDCHGALDALSLVDDTLSTIYATRSQPLDYAVGPSKLTSQRSAPQLSLSSPKPVEEFQHKARTSPGVEFKASRPLQTVFASTMTLNSSVLTKAIPVNAKIPPPPPPPIPTQEYTLTAQSTTTSENPDLLAKDTLRDMQEELEQLRADSRSSISQRHQLRRSLSDKYLHSRLNKLRPTPFVQLARRKAQQKIDSLDDLPAPVTEENNRVTPTQMIRGLPSNQHDVLVKLAHIPDSHIAKLSTTQVKLVQFAKRYFKITSLSPEQSQNLPISQKQLLDQLKEQYLSLDFGNTY